MRLTCFGHAVFAVALAGLGVLSLVSGDFACVWQPVPPWVPGRPVLAYASGALLLGCGAGLLWPRTRTRTPLVLALYGLASMLLLHVPHIAMKSQEEARWFGLAEIAIIVAGAWILFACAAPAPASGGAHVIHALDPPASHVLIEDRARPAARRPSPCTRRTRSSPTRRAERAPAGRRPSTTSARIWRSRDGSAEEAGHVAREEGCGARYGRPQRRVDLCRP